MKNILLFASLFMAISLNAQTYHPFPANTASWNILTWAQWNPDQVQLFNAQYLMHGDTMINGTSYKKMFYYAPDMEIQQERYIGGLREDNSRNIYFFPTSQNIPGYSAVEFPTDTTEYLLYTFNNLQIGQILPINQEVVEVKVQGIDSVLIGDSYRKRYEIQDRALGPDYWIEGIGSTKDLFMPYTLEFEWSFYTLCFTDTETYHINWPVNGDDSCHYTTVGFPEAENAAIRLYPNPATNYLTLEIPGENCQQEIEIYDLKGRLVLRESFENSPQTLDIRRLPSGTYFLSVGSQNKPLHRSFTKI